MPSQSLPQSSPQPRMAVAADAPSVASCVNTAYHHYIERIGKPPGPMLDDYAAIIREHAVYVIDEPADETQPSIQPRVVGVLVLMEIDELAQDGAILLDNIAVHPDVQGHGYGRLLMDLAEAQALAMSYTQIRLYTHELMVENIALYARLGYVESERRVEKGYQRIYMSKVLAGGVTPESGRSRRATCVVDGD